MTARSVVIDGIGGQGVRVIGNTMATLLGVMGYEVTLLYDYDSSVRGGMSEAFLKYDRDPISNPVVELADVTLRLADRGPAHLASAYVVADIGLARPDEQAEEIPFMQLGSSASGATSSATWSLSAGCCDCWASSSAMRIFRRRCPRSSSNRTWRPSASATPRRRHHPPHRPRTGGQRFRQRLRFGGPGRRLAQGGHRAGHQPPAGRLTARG